MTELLIIRKIRSMISDCLLDMNYDEIAKILGVNVTTIYRWQSGKALPNAYHYELLRKLCRDIINK